MPRTETTTILLAMGTVVMLAGPGLAAVPGQAPINSTPGHVQVIEDIAPGSPGMVTIDPGERGRLGVHTISIRVDSPVTNLTLTISPHQDEPGDVNSSVGGQPYRYLEIRTSDLNTSQIDNATIRFDINRSWIEDNDIDLETVRLARYIPGNRSRWQELPAAHIEETTDSHLFNATTPGFSYFAIAANETTADEDEQNRTACGNDICEEGETWETCPADCNNPEDVQGAQEAIERAEERIPARSTGYRLLEEARKAYDEENYLKAQARAEQALYEYRNAQGPGLLFMVAVVLTIAAITLLLYRKKDEIQEHLTSEDSASSGSGASETLGEPFIEDGGDE